MTSFHETELSILSFRGRICWPFHHLFLWSLEHFFFVPKKWFRLILKSKIILETYVTIRCLFILLYVWCDVAYLPYKQKSTELHSNVIHDALYYLQRSHVFQERRIDANLIYVGENLKNFHAHSLHWTQNWTMIAEA